MLAMAPRFVGSIPGRALLALALLAALVLAALAGWRYFAVLVGPLWRQTDALRRRVLQSRPAQAARRRFPRAWAFVAARFAPGEYLGLHLTIGLVLAAAALLLFSVITEDVVERETLARFDLQLAAAWRASATPTGAHIFSIVTQLGSGAVIALVGVAVAAVLLARRRRYLAVGWVAAIVGAWILNLVLKLVVQRPRPTFANRWVTVHTFSFPSGHAMSSLVTYGMLAYVLVLAVSGSRARRFIVLAALLLVLAIGFSRLYLGVHYFSDVMGGYAGGVVWLTACISGTEIARRHARERGI